MNDAPELKDEAPAAEPAHEPATPVPTEQPRPGLLARFRNYAWDWRAVVAVGIATFIMGGLAGLAVGLASGGGHHERHGFRYGPGGNFQPGQQGGFPGGPMPGQ